jgi:transposase
VYLTRIDGIDVTTALAVICATGSDMSRFASVKHFACWLGLCPGTATPSAASGKCNWSCA